MKPPGINLIVAIAATLILNNPANSQTEQQKSQSIKIPLPDSVFFNSLVALYVQSIDQADTILASNIWAPTAEISFINPSGTEYGWNGVSFMYITQGCRLQVKGRVFNFPHNFSILLTVMQNPVLSSDLARLIIPDIHNLTTNI